MHGAYLVIATYEVHRMWVLDLESKQQADGLEAVRSPVDIVAQEQVIDVGDVACSAGRAILLEQPHEVAKLAVQVAKDLHRRCTGYA